MSTDLQGVKVVCFYPWVPFLPSGAWTRYMCLWKYLLSEGAEVTLAFLAIGNDARLKNLSVRFLGEHTIFMNMGAVARVLAATPPTSELRQFSPIEVDFLLRYEKSLYLANPKLNSWLNEIVESHDVVTCEYPLYAPLLSDYSKKFSKPLVVTCLDVLYELHASHPGAKARLKEKELHALGLADALVFCNESERALFAAEGLKGTTVLNTGDVLKVKLGDEERSRMEVRTALKFSTEQYCLFVGSNHRPNIEAAEEVRQMAKHAPEITFVVAGTCSTPFTEVNCIGLGAVSERFMDTLHRGALAVIVPLTRGTGMSIKTFHAFTYGKPVVSTPVGARGFTVRDGEELLLVSSPADFPTALRRLISDEGLRARIGIAARAYALTLDYRTHFKPYGEIINRLLNRAEVIEPARAPALVLVDNNLTDRIGHHFNYALSLKQECEHQGIPFSTLVKQSAPTDVLTELSAIGTFSQGIHEESPLNRYPPEWGWMRATYDLLLSNDTFARELEAGLTGAARSGDLIFLPNATPRQIIGLALLLFRSPAHRTLRYVLILRYSIYGVAGGIADRKSVLDQVASDQYQMAIDKLMSADQEGAVRLATDSAELAQEYSALCKRNVEVLPIPHTLHPAPTAPLTSVPRKLQGKLRIVYLGDARDEKGFELLPAIIRACATDRILASAEFVFQAFISSYYHYRMTHVIAEIEQLKRPNVRLIKKSLTSDEYQALLVSADLVLLPYDAATYRARTSGPFVEALCADKPVVVPSSSWMSAQLGDSRAGVTFASGQTQDLIRAVSTALKNISQYASAATVLGKRFREYHNPENFLRQLIRANATSCEKGESATPNGGRQTRGA